LWMWEMSVRWWLEGATTIWKYDTKRSMLKSSAVTLRGTINTVNKSSAKCHGTVLTSLRISKTFQLLKVRCVAPQHSKRLI
jgi:hypothetical protein